MNICYSIYLLKTPVSSTLQRARLFQTSSVSLKRSARRSDISGQDYNYGELITEAENYTRETGSMPNASMTGEALKDSLNSMKQDKAKKNRMAVQKLIEQKYFKNLYKIKQGEKYSRAKDPYFKNAKNSSDFHHPHHFSTKKSSYKRFDQNETKTINEIDHYNEKSKAANPLNPIEIASHLYGNYKQKIPNAKLKGGKLSPREAYIKLDQEVTDDIIYDEDKEQKFEKQDPNLISFTNYNGPNLLTFAMKEQMRYLYSSDPENWSPKALSTVYPVSPSAALKVVKSNWRPADEDGLARHDNKVVKNWENFTHGKVKFVKLIEEIIERRKGNLLQTESSVPALTPTSEQMERILSGLHFDGLDDELRMRGAAEVRQKPRQTPRGGQWIDIIKKYESAVNSSSKGEEHEEVNDNKYKELPMCTKEDIDKFLPKLSSYDGDWVEINVKNKKMMGKSKLNNLITYDDFLKAKKL